MLRDVPRYECLLKAAEEYPSLNPSACDAFLHLLRTGDTVFSAESRYLAQYGISQGRFTVLMLLHGCQTQRSTPAELADEAGVTRATITGLIDTLEKDELVTRENDPNDRRTVLVRLTESGRTFLERMIPGYFECVSAMMRALSESERKQLVRLLQKVQQEVSAEQSPVSPVSPVLKS